MPALSDKTAHAFCELARLGFLAIALGGPVFSQALAEASQRILVEEARRLIRDRDATVRGEAALVLAASGENAHHDLLLSIASDGEQQARLRGILAVGILGCPGSAAFLDRVLSESGTRVRPEGIVAAYALGAMPADAASAALGNYLSRVLQSSYRRQRDALLSMLIAFQSAPHPAQALALSRILEDDANRDHEIRAQILRILGRADRAPADETLLRVLREGTPPERLAVLRIAASRLAIGERWIDALVASHQRDPSSEVRALSLAILARARHLPALELAARAAKGGHPLEIEEGVRALLLLGGGSLRRAVTENILTCHDTPRLEAMLRGFEGRPDRDLAVHCREIAADQNRPPALRARAALIAARGLGKAAAPVLRDLAAADLDGETLASILSALASVQRNPPPVADLFRAGRIGLAGSDARLRALLVSRYPQASRALLDCLARPDAKIRARALHAIFLAMRPGPDPEDLALSPEPLASLLR